MRRLAGTVVIAGAVLVAGCSANSGGAAGPAPATSAAVTPVSVPTSASASVPSKSPSVPAASGSAGDSAVPVLGQSRGPTKGYGSARPSTIFNGGDPTGLVTGVTWSSWGGPKAIGSGMADYDPPGRPVADSVRERATVVAFDLTTCDGTYMYEAIEWYFPESGGTFSPAQYLDDCSWTYQGNQ